MNKKIFMAGLMGALMMFGTSVLGDRVLAAENATNAATTTSVIGAKQNLIGEEKAVKIALDNTTNGELRKIDLDRSRGRLVYEIEVLEGNREKEFKIDAQTGEILKIEYDNHDSKIRENAKISFDEAMKIANQKAVTGEFKSIELKTKRGQLVYEIELQDGKKEKEFEIDAQTGKILKYKVENDRW